MKEPGFVYVIQMEGHDYYKIGRTSNIKRRMSELGIQLPRPYRVILARRVADAAFTEKRLHEDFRGVRMNGEWFCLTQDHIQEIRAYLLFVQANDLISRVLRALAADDELFPTRLTQYGKILMRMGWRTQRRLEVYADLHHARCVAGLSDPILEAEIVG